MNRIKTSNPIEVAVAAAFVQGTIHGGQVQEFASTLAGQVKSTAVEIDGWESAIEPWIGREQTVANRGEAQRLVRENKTALLTLASSVADLATITGTLNPDTLMNRLLQYGVVQGNDDPSLGDLIGHAGYLNKGTFAALPGGMSVPLAMPVGQESSTHTEIPVDKSLLTNKTLARLSSAMTQQWGMLHERGQKGFVNVNTLNRYVYNKMGTDTILEDFDKRDVKDARVLLVTGYETPIHDLLESGRVKEVVVVDFSPEALETVATKYANHPYAKKLRLQVTDYSGISSEFQADAMQTFSPENRSSQRPGAEVVRKYFSEIAQPENQNSRAFDDASFDAVHMPFVAGSMQFGAVTDAIARYSSEHDAGWMGYDDYLGAENLDTPEARAAALTVVGHVFDESKRICKPGAKIITNMWARPHTDAPKSIRLSDTPVPKESFDNLLQGFKHLFSGNPQPTLPHTVGHILEFTANE